MVIAVSKRFFERGGEGSSYFQDIVLLAEGSGQKKNVLLLLLGSCRKEGHLDLTKLWTIMF